MSDLPDLPDLPPGWAWWRYSDPRGPLAQVSAGGFRGLDLWPHDSTDEVADLLERVRDAHDTILRAAIQAAADAAGVVLPEDYDPEAVLRDGLEATAWSWVRQTSGHLLLWRGVCATRGRVVHGRGTWEWQTWHESTLAVTAAGTAPTEAEACAAACEALGVPCPPIPEVKP